MLKIAPLMVISFYNGKIGLLTEVHLKIECTHTKISKVEWKTVDYLLLKILKIEVGNFIISLITAVYNIFNAFYY